jgi:hypothetical protein
MDDTASGDSAPVLILPSLCPNPTGGLIFSRFSVIAGLMVPGTYGTQAK